MPALLISVIFENQIICIAGVITLFASSSFCMFEMFCLGEIRASFLIIGAPYVRH